MKPPHRPYYHWPSFALRVIVTRLHPFMPWTALGARLELMRREQDADEQDADEPPIVSIRVGSGEVGI